MRTTSSPASSSPGRRNRAHFCSPDASRYKPFKQTGAISKQCIGPSFVSRIYRLVLLAPDTLEAILEGRQPAHLTLKDLMDPFPVEWVKQRAYLCPV